MSERRGWPPLIALGAGLTLLAPFAAAATWRGDTQLHTLMEVVATLLALVAGGIALIHHLARRDVTLLLVGVGFVGTGMLDGYHAVVTSSWFGHLWPSPPPSLIPWSWNASRVFLSVLLVLATWLPTRHAQLKTRSVVTQVSALAVGCFALFAMAPLPDAYVDGVVGRPEELLSAALFAVALFRFWRRDAWRDDPLEAGLVLSLVAGVVCQAAYMPFSHSLFDPMFDAAHILKIVSYLCVVGGVFLSIYHTVLEARRTAAELARHRGELQTLVDERTAALAENLEQLRRARRAALNIARDAEDARAMAVEASEALEIANRELEQFAYAASHDLQEPLRTITSYLQLIQRRYRGQLDGDADEFIDFATSAAQRLKTLVQDLLAYSRLERAAAVLQPVALEPVVHAATRALELLLSESGAEVTVLGELPTVMADGGQLALLVQNLLSNAVNYRSEAAPRIEVTATRPDGGHWQITFRDNGIGFDQKHAERIFGVFKRLHGVGERAGTGIGLAICRRIVERHGGRIWGQSQLGAGSAFHFTVPAATRDAA